MVDGQEIFTTSSTMTTDIHAAIRAEIFADIPTVAQVRRELAKEIDDPEVSLFRDLRSLSSSDWERFNCSTGEFEPDGDGIDGDDDDDVGIPRREMRKKKRRRKIHKRRSFHYKIGQYNTSTYYTKFLSDSDVRVPGASNTTVRELTRQLSLNPKSTFRSWFRMPLYKVEEICQRLIQEQVLNLSHHCRSDDQLMIKCKLLVLGSLAILGGCYTTFRQIPTLTNIGATEHSKFFKKFVHFLWSVRNEFIHLPRDEEELRIVMKRYEEMGLPGAMGSVDVVHVKWSNCPAGDFNRAKGKESYPSLGFECISDFDRRICNVYGPSFGSRNDKHIVKNDVGVRSVAEDWYSSVQWKYYDNSGDIQLEEGAYLICDNGYLQWPTLICPFM